ncbi:MAG: imidazole glycerol phosphate synthase subunit HisH, partial [Chromatiaceae bacterium]|nr:imidazole glycerol phosphate synthase subunit HisH [Chromatiaceae bacterium]
MISLLDYGAGNVRSVRNAVLKLGHELKDIRTPEDIHQAEFILFPGVGSYGSAMQRLHQMGYFEPLRDYLRAGRPFLGICIGLQALFEGSDESPGVAGLGIIPGQVRRFEAPGLAVPHMGWNGIRSRRASSLLAGAADEKLYFVHSYRAVPGEANADWVLAETDYGGAFISAVRRGPVAAVQFHPEKSGPAGLRLLDRFLRAAGRANGPDNGRVADGAQPAGEPTRLAKRVIACLDVRANDAGDLVVTKGDQYD